jgi:signal transduction histidine kinase
MGIMKVLIVDGSKQKRRDLVELLGDVANVVIQGAVPDLRSALRAVAEVSPDVIITGPLLPDGDGMHLIQRVRRLAHLPAVIVVAATECAEQRERYLAAGADRYVSEDELKPTLTSFSRIQRLGSIPPEESQRLLGRMAAGVVHDLNNYLNVIEVTVRLLRRDPDDADHLWQQLRAALDAIARLTTNLTAYARGAIAEPEEQDLGAIVREVLALIARIVPMTIVVATEIDAKARVVRGVRAELEQLVLNLVINAIDAMPDGGELHVVVRYRSHTAVLEVADTGRGMFAPSLGDLSLSTKRPGIGLGLGIVRSVVERQRGVLRIVPRSTGGTTVTVMLPTA